MAAVPLPFNPSIGQVFTVNGLRYIWDGRKWVLGPTIGQSGTLPSTPGNWVWNGTTQQWVLITSIPGIGATVNTGAAWDWPQQYTDPLNYTARVIPPGYNTGLLLATGAYPPGYRIANGTIGGALATGTSDGTLPIRIQPPTSGVGPLKFAIQYKMAVVNNTATAGSCTVILGTTSSSGPSKPLYPYLGVGHDNSSIAPITIPPNSVVQINTGRLDVVDNALEADQPIPGWPNWTMLVDQSAGASLLYPAICPIFTNNGTVPLTVRDIFAFGFAVGDGITDPSSGGGMSGLPTGAGTWVWNGSSQLWVPLASTQVRGVTDGSNAPAGFIGERLTAVSLPYPASSVTAQHAPIPPALPVYTVIGTLPLPSGDWDIFSNLWIEAINVVGLNNYWVSLLPSSFSLANTDAADPATDNVSWWGEGGSPAVASGGSLGPIRINSQVSTSVDLRAEVIGTSGVAHIDWIMVARRVR